jgi:hypothetical protein
MRLITFVILNLVTGVLLAQSPVTKSFAVSSGQKISLKFDYPEMIKVTTWDKNEVSITGTVNINSGESDDAFEISQSTVSNTLSIEGSVRNLKNLPQRITIRRGEEKIVFRTKADFEKYCH